MSDRQPYHPSYLIWDSKHSQWRLLTLLDYFTPVGFICFNIASSLLGLMGSYLILRHLHLPKGPMRTLVRVTAISDLILILLFSIPIILMIVASFQVGDLDNQAGDRTAIFWVGFSLTILQDFFRFFSIVIPIAIVYHQFQIVVRERAISSIRVIPTLICCCFLTLCISLLNIPFYLQSFGNYVYASLYKMVHFGQSIFFLLYFLVFLAFYFWTCYSLQKMRKYPRSKKSSATIDLMQNLASAITISNILFMGPQVAENFAADLFALNGILDSPTFYAGQVLTALRMFSNTAKGFFHAIAVMYCKYRYDQSMGKSEDINFGQKLYRTIFAKTGDLQDELGDYIDGTHSEYSKNANSNFSNAKIGGPPKLAKHEFQNFDQLTSNDQMEQMQTNPTTIGDGHSILISQSAEISFEQELNSSLPHNRSFLNGSLFN